LIEQRKEIERQLTLLETQRNVISVSNPVKPKFNYISKKPEQSDIKPDLIDELRQVREAYLKDGGNDVEYLAELADLEKRLLSTSAPSTLEDILPKRHRLEDEITSERLAHELAMLKLQQKKERIFAEREMKDLEEALTGREQEIKTQTSPQFIQKSAGGIFSSDAYDPKRGLNLKLISIVGLEDPNIVHNCTLTLNVAVMVGRDVSKSVRTLQTRIKNDGCFSEELELLFNNVKSHSNTRVIVDIRFTKPNSKMETSIGWTTFDIFKRDEKIDAGFW
jgi:hypothetical protein